MLNGGDEENRTPDPLLARQVLSQLSYAPIYLLVILSQYFVVSSSPSVDVRFMYISVRFVVTPRPVPKFLRNTLCNYACQQNNCASFLLSQYFVALSRIVLRQNSCAIYYAILLIGKILHIFVEETFWCSLKTRQCNAK